MTRLLAGAWLLVVVACVSVTGGPTSPPLTDRPTPAAPVTTLSAASLPPSAAPESIAPAMATTEPEPTDDEPLPPTALLTLADGASVAGTLGSYAYGGAAADTPWLPARVLTPTGVGAGAILTLTVDPGEAFVRWGARYAAADDETADVITQLAAGGDGTTPLDEARFGAPPSGEWVVMIQLFFGAEAGDAAYYWYLDVP